MVTILALVFALGVQDAESRYREALYLEVDKGDVDGALDLYGKIESDASAPEAARAKAAFRRAWCLEKKGRRAEAEKAYRAVVAAYPAQAETAAKARERLDRIAMIGGETTRSVSPEDRIAELVLALGAGAEEANRARRSLVLIGDPAVPALRKALAHKDVSLSSMAASTLVEIGREEGTFPALLQGTREGAANLWARDGLETLLRRHADLRKEFAEALKREDMSDHYRLQKLLDVARRVEIPEAREWLRELVMKVDPDLVGDVIQALAPSEEQVVEFLRQCRGTDTGQDRAKKLLKSLANARVKDPRALLQAVVSVFPEYDSIFFDDLQRHVSAGVMFAECGAAWLRSAEPNLRDFLVKEIGKLGKERADVILALLGAGLPEETRFQLLLALGVALHPPGAAAGGTPGPTQQIWRMFSGSSEKREPSDPAAAEKVFWHLFDHEKKGFRDAAAEALLNIVPETHPRWPELIREELSQPLPDLTKGWPVPSKPDAPAHGSIFFRYSAWTKQAQAQARDLVYKQALRPEENLSLMAVHLINWVGDLDRIEVLSKVALDDQGRSPELRIQAIESMTGGNEWPEKVPPALLKLAEEKDPGVRAAAVRAAAGWRSAETDRLILPLVTDDDEAVVKVALEYLSGSEGEHRAEHFSAFEKALKSRHAGVRRLAAAELGHLESIKAVPRLIPLLDDPDSQVREQARGALAQIKSRYEEKAQWLEWYDRVKPKEK